MDYRFLSGGFLEPGPAQVWLRMRQPLIEDEPDSPLTRVLVAADSGNGVSAALDYRRWLFINTELTVHLVREPAGEWICLDAITRAGPEGVGLAESVLWDERGRLGRGGADPAGPAALRSAAGRGAGATPRHEHPAPRPSPASLLGGQRRLRPPDKEDA